MSQSQALDGVRVVDLSWVVAGPMVGRAMADYGATVVRVESSRRIDTARLIGPFHGGEDGPDRSACYGNANAGKLGISLDLSTAEARAVVRDLVRWSGVVIESFSPGVMARWGLDYEELRRFKPELVMLSTSLMGQTGPLSSFAGFGNVGSAMSGFADLTGWPEEAPSGPYGPYTDYVGPRFGLALLLAALDHRRRTGEGCHLDVSQVEAALQFLAPQIAESSVNGAVERQWGNRDAQMVPHGVYACRRDEQGDTFVAIAVRDGRDWGALASVLRDPTLSTDNRFATTASRRVNVDVIDERVSTWAASRTAAEAAAALQAVGVPAHLVASSADMAADEQLREQNHFVEVPHAALGTTTVEGPRIGLSATPGRTRRAAPTTGEHNEHVLHTVLGYSVEHVAELTAAGALV